MRSTMAIVALVVVAYIVGAKFPGPLNAALSKVGM